MSPLAFIKCVLEAGIPQGVLNAVTGPGSAIGPMLIKNPRVKKVAFTGSTSMGKQVLSDRVDTLTKVSLELGGSLPMIVCKDYNLDEAVNGAVRRSFRNMCQICIAVNRIYVHKDIYKRFLDKFAAKTKELTVGNGQADNCDCGPMYTKSGLDTVEQHIEDGVAKGAKVICGGNVPEGYEEGNFFEPTILRDVNYGMLVMSEETFGPLVGIMPYADIDEAVKLANDIVYGLASIVYTDSLGIAEKYAREIEAGNVAINNPDAGVINAPYGGWKDSGFGH